MKWQNQRRSSNVEDRRGQSSNNSFGFPSGRNGFGFPSSRRSSGSGFGFPIPIPIPMSSRGRGSGCLLPLFILLIFILFRTGACSIFEDDRSRSNDYSRGGYNEQYDQRYEDNYGNGKNWPNSYSKRAGQANQANRSRSQANDINGDYFDESDNSSLRTDDELADFSSVVLALTEDVWTDLFRQNGERYTKPKLVIYDKYTQSGCGFAQSQTGPFYCPNDQKVYVDLSFYDEMQTKLGAKGGDFAFAYVLAHEIGHHVQNQLGVLKEVQSLQRQLSSKEANQLSVRLELQADYFAGVFAHYIQELSLLDEGDIEEAIDAASAVGDDRIQKSAQGYVVPDSFTHGTSKQRITWFMKGFKSGDMWAGDTFSASRLD